MTFFRRFAEQIRNSRTYERTVFLLQNWYFRRIVRVVQITGLSYAIYQTGYSNGIIDYAIDPKKMDEGIMNYVISSNNATLYHNAYSEGYNRVERVGSRVVSSAQHMVEGKVNTISKEIHTIEDKLRDTTDSTKRNELILRRDHLKEDIQPWLVAFAKIQGQWEFIVTNSSIPNAFVVDMCPRRIFVNEGLLREFNPSDDELAVVLSHEISHVILDHLGNRLKLSAVVGAVHLALLAFVDPIGITSAIFEVLMYYFANFFEAAHSREDETQADSLGVVIAHSACYSPVKGIIFFQKLAEYENHRTSSWSSTHPSTVDRFVKLLQESNEIEISKHQNCKTFLEAFQSTILSYRDGIWNKKNTDNTSNSNQNQPTRSYN